MPQSSSNNWSRGNLGMSMNQCPSEMKDMNYQPKPSMMSQSGLNQMVYTNGSFTSPGNRQHSMNNSMSMMNSSIPSWGMHSNAPDQRQSYPFMSPMAPQAVNNQGLQQQRQNYYDQPLYVENPQIPQNQYQMSTNENFARVNSNPNPCNNSNCLRCKKPTM
ncbi:unnamed protein product [Diamesa serratosioi]